MAAARGMVTVAEARRRALKKVLAEQRDWAAVGGSEARLEIVLHPPTERAALADQGGAIEWVRTWQQADAADAALKVAWGGRQWSRVGAQSVPERCVLRGADAIAAFAGGSAGRDWRLLRNRAAVLRGEFSDRAASTAALAGAVRTQARTLQGLSEPDFATLIQVVAWLAEHPASGWRIRQLPIRGIDTKWLERHRSVVESLHAAVSGRLSLGLLDAPNLVRVRFLDPALRPGGLRDVVSPVDELAALDVAPNVVFVFENLETMFSMPDLPGAVVVHGSGYGVNRLALIPWIRHGRVVYWGDLDSDGFSILHVLRSGCDDVTSVLMDEDTLLAYRDLWVPEPKAAAGTYPTLTDEEQRALGRIRSEGDVRLEQERIDWRFALERLLTAAAVELGAATVRRHLLLNARLTERNL
ncbi:Wadjet anti-phage system protein JetD domain-containing protein [Cryobacterium sp. SO1]|uniref:Wadjet anti-phage system protein JetD domain-containing protein n=1 Tax=Cryobacterium sp. SO1 TaxID=1897061 RepID=UPI00102365EF|nr:DUF3322 and DUF2220 domain-containing protein [Cryobacterium sp. SO1]RZI34609.1 hypothetical protein BJQ95_03067 [Cryobacterium sp. SO1]